jgi:glycosyltransferase involved in cell wall biosynthesis
MRYMYKDRELCSGPGFAKCLSCAMTHYGAGKGAVTWASNGIMSRFQRAGVDLFLPVSTAIANTNGLFQDKRTAQKTRVVPNFIPDSGGDLDEDPDQPVAGLPLEPYILQVGDLVPDKGILVLLEAYQGLRQAPPLVLIGRRTSESPRVLPPNVTLVESLPHLLVMRAWRRSLFGVVPSINIDASPTVTLEAMVSGKAVVGSRIGGIVDQVVDGETGLLVPAGEPDALCEALQQLIDHPDLRDRMGAAGRARVKDFQASTVVTRIEKAYQTL